MWHVRTSFSTRPLGSWFFESGIAFTSAKSLTNLTTQFVYSLRGIRLSTHFPSIFAFQARSSKLHLDKTR